MTAYLKRRYGHGPRPSAASPLHQRARECDQQRRPNANAMLQLRLRDMLMLLCTGRATDRCIGLFDERQAWQQGERSRSSSDLAAGSDEGIKESGENDA